MRNHLRRSWGLVLVLALFPAGGGGALAAGAGGTALPASPPAPPASPLPKVPPETGDGLPPVIARYPGGLLTRGRLRERLLAEIRGNPLAFDLPEAFLVAEMLRRERQRLELPPPDPAQADMRMKMMEDESGGRAGLVEQLATAGLTYNDAWRMSLRDAELADAAAFLLKPAPRGRLTSEEMEQTLRMLRRRYRPVWSGPEAEMRVAAFADGRNLTRDDLLDFVMREGGDLALDGVLESALASDLWALEAGRLGVDNTPAAAEAHYNRSLDEAALEAFYRDHARDMELVRLDWILIPWRPAPGDDPAAPPTEEVRANTYYDAMRLRADLQDGRLSFENAALGRSACRISAPRRGMWGFVPGADWVARAFEPDAWRLGYFRENGQEMSPVAPAPDPAVRAVLPGLEPDRLSEPVETARGYALLRRSTARAAPPLERVRGALRRWLVEDRRRTREKELRAEVEILWSPLTSR